jgi:hypothetical protein
MNRPSNSNECLRCPGHASLWVDGPVTLRLCYRCWSEWRGSAVRGQVLKMIHAFQATGYDEAAPRQIREDEP